MKHKCRSQYLYSQRWCVFRSLLCLYLLASTRSLVSCALTHCPVLSEADLRQVGHLNRSWFFHSHVLGIEMLFQAQTMCKYRVSTVYQSNDKWMYVINVINIFDSPSFCRAKASVGSYPLSCPRQWLPHCSLLSVHSMADITQPHGYFGGKRSAMQPVRVIHAGLRSCTCSLFLPRGGQGHLVFYFIRAVNRRG